METVCVFVVVGNGEGKTLQMSLYIKTFNYTSGTIHLAACAFTILQSSYYHLAGT